MRNLTGVPNNPLGECIIINNNTKNEEYRNYIHVSHRFIYYGIRWLELLDLQLNNE